MHDIKAIRDNPQAFDDGLARRGLAPLSASLLVLDMQRREHMQKLQEAQDHDQNHNHVGHSYGIAKTRHEFEAEIVDVK